VFYTSIASINTPDYVEIHLYRRATGRSSFTARLVIVAARELRGQVLQTRKLTVTVQRSLLAHVYRDYRIQWACELPVVILA